MLLIKYGIVVFEEVQAHNIEIKTFECKNGVIAIARIGVVYNVILHRNKIVLATHNEMNIWEPINLWAWIALAYGNLSVRTLEFGDELVDRIHNFGSHIIWEKNEGGAAVDEDIIWWNFNISVQFGFVFSGICRWNHLDAFEWNKPHSRGPSICQRNEIELLVIGVAVLLEIVATKTNPRIHIFPININTEYVLIDVAVGFNLFDEEVLPTTSRTHPKQPTYR